MTLSEDERIAASVEKNGWHALAVEGTELQPGFFYTIGLCTTFNHPEIVICGLKPKVAHALVSRMIERLRAGHRYEPEERNLEVIEGYPVALRSVHATQRIIRLGYANAYYRKRGNADLLSALQVQWSDKDGRLPFQLTCDPEVVRLQPRLDLPAPPAEIKEFMDRRGRAES